MKTVRTFFSSLREFIAKEFTLYNHSITKKEHLFSDEFSWYEEHLQQW